MIQFALSVLIVARLPFTLGPHAVRQAVAQRPDSSVHSDNNGEDKAERKPANTRTATQAKLIDESRYHLKNLHRVGPRLSFQRVQDLESERQQAFSWFDSLHYGILHAPLIEIFDSDRQNLISFGLLIRPGKHQFEYFGLSSGREIANEKSTYRIIDLRTWLNRNRTTLLIGKSHCFVYLDTPYVDVFTRFLLSRICAKRGWKDLSMSLFMAARSTPEEPYQVSQRALGDGFLVRLKANVAATERENLFRSVMDDRYPYESNVLAAKAYLRTFPDAENDELRQKVERLLNMLQNRRPPDPRTATRKQWIQEWIDELQYYDERSMRGPGFHPFYIKPSPPHLAADHLFAAGFSAVPQLLAALNDLRPTFTEVRRGFSFGAPSTPLLVNEAVLGILAEIRGSGFTSRFGDDDASKSKPDFDAWWEKAKGLTQTKWEENERILSQSRLSRLSPSQALAIIKDQVETTSSEFELSSLLGAAIIYGGRLAEPFLRDTMLHSRDTGLRILAANALIEYDSVASVLQMIHEFQPNAKIDHWEEMLSNDFLVSAEDPSVFPPLIARIRRFEPNRRAEILMRSEEAFSGDYEEWNPSNPRSKPPLVRERVKRGIERLLASELDDTERITQSISIGQNGFSDTRLCNIASFYLAALFPDHGYIYEATEEDSVSERIRAVNLKAWRRVKSQPVPM